MAPPKTQSTTASASDAVHTTSGTSASTGGSAADGEAATAAPSSNASAPVTSAAAKSSALARASPTPPSLPPPSYQSSSSSANPHSSSSSHKHSAPVSSSYSILPKMSDPTPPPTTAASSSKRSSRDAAAAAATAASATSAASAVDASKDSVASTPAGTPSPYGTRSRNRTGGARPNYAEDKDLDGDLFEMYPERREDEPKKPASRSAAAAAANGASSAAAALEKEPLRPTNGGSGSGSTGDRVRKPLPTGTSPSSDAHHHAGNGNGGRNGNGNGSHQNGSSSSRSAALQKDQSAAVGASSAQENGTQTASNPRKRKATVANDKTAAGNGTAQGASGNSHGPSLRKGGAGATSTTSKGDVKGYPNTNLMTFEKRGAKPNKDGKMIADDGTVLCMNDHVYLVCEPPGEPYYLARVMEFLHAKNDPSQPVDALRVNWYYRPRDIGRKAQDTRYVFATMHSDITPLTALRGKCTIKHKAEIDSLDEFHKTPDCFWFEKLYDRYIQKNYEVIPTFQIINVPERVKKVLDERWRYVLVEQGRGKDLTSAAKQCKRCSGFCASNNSVDCAVCAHTYHMNCVRPPLLKKPSRGFAWSCAACSRAQERLLEARHTPNVIDGRTPDAAASAATTAVDDEDFDDDDDMPGPDTNRTSPEEEEDAHPPATAEQQYQASLWPYRYLGMHCKVEDALDYDDRIYPRAATRVGPRHQANVGPWPGRPVQYVMPPDIKKATRREARQNKEALAAYEREREKRPKWIQDTPPGYVERGLDLDENDPKCTSCLVYKAPSSEDTCPAPKAEETEDAKSKMDLDPPEDSKALALTDEAIDKYMAAAVKQAPKLGVPPRSTNLYHMAMTLLYKNKFDTEKAFSELDQLKPTDFKEPVLSSAEQKKFEEAVLKFGSELALVTRHVKTVFYGDIVRFYYAWKKSERGKQVWGNNAGRKGKKEEQEAKKAEAEAASKFQDDVADDNDDSAFDTDKAESMKRQFLCRFCNTKSSRQWRRAPTIAPTAVLSESLGGGNSKNSHRDRSHNQHNQQYVVSLCRRCAELWRRYAVQWEDTEALSQKAATLGVRLLKRKIDEEIYKEILAADEMMRVTDDLNHVHSGAVEPPRKRVKGHGISGDKDGEPNASDSASSTVPPATSSGRRRDRSDKSHADKADKADKGDKADKAGAAAEKATSKNGTDSTSGAAGSAGSSTPDIPEPRKLPCAVCRQMDLPTGDQRLSCRDCRLTVHRSCYGVIDNRNPAKWFCDMCSNDRNPHVSIDYRCVLCPVEHTDYDFVEPPRPVHKKKSDKERERERIEREQAVKAAEYYRRRQEELNKPTNPREPLKRTADNNWVHVTCAVWTPEVKFSNASALEPSEGIPSVPRARYSEVCKLCRGTGGACVPCHQCRALFHVECAHQAGHMFGFDLVPIKGSRRDQANVLTVNGVTGQLTAAIWCKEHVPLKNSVHLMHETIDNSKMTAMQLYIDHYKQADLTLTGCARKANLLTLAAKMSGTPGSTVGGAAGSSAADHSQQVGGSSSSGRRSSLFINGGSNSANRSLTPEPLRPGGKICFTCGTDVSPKWYPIDKAQERELTNGFYGKLGSEAQKFVAQRNFQCHKCKKAGKQPQPHDNHYGGGSGYSSGVKMEEDPYAETMQRLAPQYSTQSLHSQQQQQQQSQHQHQYLRPPLLHYNSDQSNLESNRSSMHAPPPPAPPLPPSAPHSPERSRYWQTTNNTTAVAATASSSSALAPPPPPPLPPHQPSGISMRPTPSGSPPQLHAPVHHSSHSPPVVHRSMRTASILPPRAGPPPPPLSYGGSPPPPIQSYGDWRRSASSAPGPPPSASSVSSSRRDPLVHSSSSSSIPPLAHNHLRPPPLSIAHSTSSSGMQNGVGSSYMGGGGQSLLNGRPPSPRSRMSSGPSLVSGPTGGSSYSPYGQSSPPMSSSRMANGGSGHLPFSQVLHPHRSGSSSSGSSFANVVSMGANNVTREDFTTLGRDRDRDRDHGPLSMSWPSESRTSGSAASSNPSLRNLLS